MPFSGLADFDFLAALFFDLISRCTSLAPDTGKGTQIIDGRGLVRSQWPFARTWIGRWDMYRLTAVRQNRHVPAQCTFSCLLFGTHFEYQENCEYVMEVTG